MRKNTVDLGAELLDLRHRVSLLEGALHGGPRNDVRGAMLIRMYLEAHKIPGLAGMPLAEAWVRQIYLLDRMTLIHLSRQVNDPFPWRPFLALLDGCVAQRIPGALEARKYLLGLAEDLLEQAGLEVLHPRDVMGSLRISEAISAISQ